MKRLSGGEGGLPPGAIRRISSDPSIDKDSVIEVYPGGLPTDLWKEILSFIYQPGDNLCLALVCKNWKLIRNALRSEWPQTMRIQTLASLFKIVKKENISQKRNSLIENYTNEQNLSFHSAYEFTKEWLKEDLDINKEKAVVNVLRGIEELTGVSNLQQIAYTNAEKLVDYAHIENPMTGLEHLDESDLSSVIKNLIFYLLKESKFEIAFAITEVAFNTHAIDLRGPLIEFLIKRFNYEQTIRLIFELGCQKFLLYSLVLDGCRDLNISPRDNLNNLFIIKTHPFFEVICKCFKETKIQRSLPRNAIDTLITELIIPLHRINVHGEIAEDLKEKLLAKAFEMIPPQYDIDRHRQLIPFYHTYFVDQELIPNARYGPESWECKDLFIKTLKEIAHLGMAKSILVYIFNEFYQLSPNMRDWWKTLRKIERVFDHKFKTRKQFPFETRATEELTYYLIKSHIFIEELNKPTEKLTHFPLALCVLLQQKPSLLNEFLFTRMREERSSDSMDLSDESALGIFQQDNSQEEFSPYSLETSEELSENSLEENFTISKRGVFNIYTCVINRLLKHQMDEVAKSVISYIEPKSLREELKGEFYGFK